jgi:hypothetical protein
MKSKMMISMFTTTPQIAEVIFPMDYSNGVIWINGVMRKAKEKCIRKVGRCYVEV